MRYGTLLMVLLLGVWIGWAQGKIEVKLKDGEALKDGQAIQGVQTLEATVQSDKLVNRVDFQVDGRVRATDQSTPYEFEWDTIPEEENEHALTIIAYLEDDKTIRQELKIKVNNEVDKGVEAHYQQALTAFQDTHYDKAVLHARVAIKAQSEHKPARQLLIQAYLRQSKWHEAEDAIEDFVRLFPNDSEGYMLRSQALLRKARNNRESDAEYKILETVIENRLKSLERMDAALPGTPGSALDLYRKGEMAFNRGDYAAAAQFFFDASRKDENNMLYLNRRIQALLRSRRYDDVLVAVNTAIRRGVANDYTYTAQGLAYLYQGKKDNAEAAFQDAAKKDKDSNYLALARAQMAIHRGDFAQAMRHLTAVSNSGYSALEVAFFRAWIYSSMLEWDRARDSFWLVLNQEPIMAEAYTLRGYESFVQAIRVPALWEESLPLAPKSFDLALKARPNYAPALLGHALHHALRIYFTRLDGGTASDEDKREAARYLGEFMRVAPNEAWAHVGAAYVYEKIGRDIDAGREMQIANKLDKDRVEDLGTPTPKGLIEIVWRFMFPPLMPNP